MKAKLFVDANMQIGKVEDNMFSSFVEQMGRGVYEGIFEPNHSNSDEDGFREDVAELVKGLHVPLIRYPGGNFVSGYNWRDGIGKKEERPVRLDLAWRTTESNEFGLDEFMKWCKKVGCEPMMAVNLGTGTPFDAVQLLEYCNHTTDTSLGKLRAQNAQTEPYHIKYWCLGNEMDGDWQIGHLTAQQYAEKAWQTAKMMRMYDPNLKLIACGSSGIDQPSYPDWDRTVLEVLYDEVDYLSLHQYYHFAGNEADYYASYKQMDNFIHSIKATCDFVKAKKRSDKTMLLSFDEWNIWYLKDYDLPNWDKAPHLIEDVYTLRDAIVFGGMLNTLLNNCDRVKIACLAQLVNVIAPILTEKEGRAIKQSTYYPFEAVSNFGRGTAHNYIMSCEKFSSKYGETDYVSTAVISDDDYVTVFLVNYANEDVELSMELRSFGELKGESFLIMDGEDVLAKNTFEEPDNVKTRCADVPTFEAGVSAVVLTPLSWNMLRFKKK